jgi:LmbE family N-acetylglucosaminyl deacetylase
VVARQDLPRVRTVELCTVLQMYGAKPPIFLGYRTLAGPEVQPTVVVDISAYKALKVQALRTYTSQEDARRLAELFERSPLAVEAFHQAYPPVPADVVTTDFWAASATPALLRADYSGVTYDTSRRP